MSDTIKGFDYTRQQSVAWTRREWRKLVADTVASGGTRRHENGETFVHAKGGALLAEAYGYVPAPTAKDLAEAAS